MSKAECSLAVPNHDDDGGEFIQVRKKSERSNNDKNSASNGTNDKKKPKPRSRNNSIGEGKPFKTRYVCIFLETSSCLLLFIRSRNSSANHGRTTKMDTRNGGKFPRTKNMARKTGKTARNYEVRSLVQIYHWYWGKPNYQDEEWRTVYIGFVERGTSSEDLAKVFKVNFCLASK